MLDVDKSGRQGGMWAYAIVFSIAECNCQLCIGCSLPSLSGFEWRGNRGAHIDFYNAVYHINKAGFNYVQSSIL